MNGKKDVDELKDHYTHLEKKIKSNESIISKANDELNEVNNELENIDNQVRYLQENITKYKHANIDSRIKDNNISYKAKFFQDASKDIEDFEKNKVVKRKDEVRRETENVKSETEMLLNILVNFSETNPEYKDIISIASEINKI